MTDHFQAMKRNRSVLFIQGMRASGSQWLMQEDGYRGGYVLHFKSELQAFPLDCGVHDKGCLSTLALESICETRSIGNGDRQ
jgi:hypothetical protein